MKVQGPARAQGARGGGLLSVLVLLLEVSSELLANVTRSLSSQAHSRTVGR